MSAHPILSDILAFIERHKMAESTFGRLALKDWKFIPDLRGDNRPAPRRLFSETEQTVRSFMAKFDAEHPIESPASSIDQVEAPDASVIPTGDDHPFIGTTEGQVLPVGSKGGSPKGQDSVADRLAA